MRVLSSFVRGVAAALALAAAAGCKDELPTANGPEQFPSLPTTIEVILPASDFLASDTVYGGFADPRTSPFLLVASQFEGALDAHTVARLTGFPDTITYAGAKDGNFTYATGKVRTIVNRAASTTGAVVLRLWELGQPFDSATVSWQNASAGTPWQTPGGTRASLISEVTWSSADTTARADSVTWSVDSLTLSRLAAKNAPGLLVTAETPGARVQFGGLSLEAGMHPSAKRDTTVTTTLTSGVQIFVFTPEAPQRAGIIAVGGVTAERSVLRLDLSRTVPTCATGNCARVPLREVTLNRAVLLLDPLAVPNGFRPLVATQLTVRRVAEPGLGRRAPLAEVVAADTITGSTFASGAGGPVSFELTGPVLGIAASDSARATVALLNEPEGANFGYAWFTDSPRLRLVYTLPLTPRLP